MKEMEGSNRKKQGVGGVGAGRKVWEEEAKREKIIGKENERGKCRKNTREE